MTQATTIRMDEGLKREASAICESMGLSFNAYVVMAVTQLVNQRKIPFEVWAPVEIPNEETRRALIEAEAKMLGLIPDDSVAFDNVEAAIEYLDS